MKLSKLSKEYFEYFKNKDIDLLKTLFAKEIELKDWDIDVKGYDNVVNQNIKIFNELKNFDLKVITIYNCKNIIFADIEITLDNSEIVNVLDVLTFDDNLKIKKIRAYKG